VAEGTLILGGGFGGLATAHALRAALGQGHPITVVDRRDHFYVGLRKLWVLVGAARMEEGRRPLARLEKKGIRFVQAKIVRIDAAARAVSTDAGEFDGDHLVIALGAEPRPDLIPGATEHAVNLYDPGSVEGATERITSMTRGRVVVVIGGLPYKCPPAPYEAAFMLDDHFRSRGVRDAIDLTFTTLQPGLLPNAGPVGARWIGDRMTERDIRWEVGKKPIRFESDRVVFGAGDGGTGESLGFDVAVLTPPHRAPAVVQESGLTGSGDWISVDPGTLETPFPNVYAIGDVTHIPLEGGAALPKAGLMAEAEGVRVALAIAARLGSGAEPPPFDGRGQCFLEMGGEKAALIQGEFFAKGGPDVRVLDVSEGHFQEKVRFEADHLKKWLG
jgi:sulfide:quinone oxidoreductase